MEKKEYVGIRNWELVSILNFQFPIPMMKDYLAKFSGTLIAALVLILLIVYLYFFGIKKPTEEEKKEKVFPTISEEQINEIELKYPSYIVVCQKEGENWFVFKDSKGFKADGKIISNMIDGIAQMKIEKVVSENPTDLAGFGLGSPKVKVIAKTPKKEHTISIGDESPIGSGTYIRVDNSNRVLLVDGSSVQGFLEKSANDLRDKQILSLEEDKIKRVKFKSKDSSFEIEKKDGNWIGKDVPEYVEIDRARIEAIIKTFLGLKIDNFEDDEPRNLTAYGLDKPSAEIELFENGKSVRVLFGNKKKEERDYYVKLASQDPVYSVSEFVFRQVPENVNDIRVRRVMELDTEKVSRLEVKRENVQISVFKKGNEWKLEGNEKIKVDEPKIYELLEEIKGLEVQEFINDNPKDLAPYGLDKPEIQITISESDKKKALLFGKKEDGKAYAKLGDGKSVYALSDDILPKIPSSRDELIKK